MVGCKKRVGTCAFYVIQCRQLELLVIVLIHVKSYTCIYLNNTVLYMLFRREVSPTCNKKLYKMIKCKMYADMCYTYKCVRIMSP